MSKSEVVRVNDRLCKRVKKLLKKNNNKLYCNSVTRFVDVSVLQLLESIKKKEDKIRWGKK